MEIRGWSCLLRSKLSPPTDFKAKAVGCYKNILPGVPLSTPRGAKILTESESSDLDLFSDAGQQGSSKRPWPTYTGSAPQMSAAPRSSIKAFHR